jgi:uncharacterized membrane protein YfcA
VYLVTDWPAFTQEGVAIALVAASVGRALLKRVPEDRFKRALGIALIVIGVLLLLRS